LPWTPHLPRKRSGAGEIQVDFNPDVVAYYHLIGYENRDVCRQPWLRHSLDFRNDAVDAGEIGDGHSATALYIEIQS
jgi:Ca-activated chloride channel family protein